MSQRWRSGQATTVRRLATDPLVPLLSLTALGLLTVPGLLGALDVSVEPVVPALTWAVLGGLAGYTLSGSV